MKKGKLYRCHKCGRHTGCLHELLPGNLWRQKCIDFHLQLPLCNTIDRGCHDEVQKNPKKYIPELLSLFGLTKSKIMRSFRQRNWNYLESIKENNKKIIEQYEVY